MAGAKDVTIIGTGHMGSAIAIGLKRSDPTISITGIDLNLTNKNTMTNAGICVRTTLPEAVTSEIIILAIPPQAFEQFSESNPQFENYAGMIISVMAGIKIPELASRLKSSQVCRAIPNLPCVINQGITALICHPLTTQTHNLLVKDLFSNLGTLLVLKEEPLIDGATALVGGGPAYVSYFAQALINYAIVAGFDTESAALMA